MIKRLWRRIWIFVRLLSYPEMAFYLHPNGGKPPSWKVPKGVCPVIVVFLRESGRYLSSDEQRITQFSYLPRLVGTVSPEHEEERLSVILTWMWSDILPNVQPIADRNGFGAVWREMCEKRTSAAARAAHAATSGTTDICVIAAGNAAINAAYATDAVREAATTIHAENAAAHTVRAGSTALAAVAHVAHAIDGDAFQSKFLQWCWQNLEKLLEVGQPRIRERIAA